MANEHQVELERLVSDLENRVRALRDFGITMVKPRQLSTTPARVSGSRTPLHEGADSVAGESASVRHGPSRGNAQPSVGAAQGSLFGPPASEKKTITVPVSRPRWTPNPLSSDKVSERLAAVRQTIGECTRCKLASGRFTIVFGEGDPTARLMFIGEGPGQEEDRTGRPFVGRAGQLLDKIIEAMGLRRVQVYIGNIVKCRPPNNRTPEDDEMRTCGQFIAQQIEIIRPRHIVCLGATAAKYLLNTNAAMNKIRGRFFDDPSGARIVPTFHPAYLLRNPAAKKLVWEDMQKVMAEMCEPWEA